MSRKIRTLKSKKNWKKIARTLKDQVGATLKKDPVKVVTIATVAGVGIGSVLFSRNPVRVARRLVGLYFSLSQMVAASKVVNPGIVDVDSASHGKF